MDARRLAGRAAGRAPRRWARAAPLGARRAAPMPAPMGAQQRPRLALSDDFRAPALRATWGAWDESDMGRFQTGRGALTVRARGDSPGHSSPLTIMARDASYQVQAVAAPRGGCGAALGLFYGPDHWLFAELKGGQVRVLGPDRTLTARAWTADAAHFKVVNRRNRVDFLASENGRDWQALAAGVDVSGFNQNALHGFQALRPALAASGAGGARFTDFRYRAL